MPYESARDPDPHLDLQEQGSEDLGEEVQRTNSELEKLRRELENIEKQKVRLEELKKRQEQIDIGREDLIDKLTRSLASIEREEEEARARLDQLADVKTNFSQHLRAIEQINPRLATGPDMSRGLTQAMGLIDDARADFNKAQSRISLPAEEAEEIDEEFENEPPVEQNFAFWLKAGFAFTLPLQLLAALTLVVWLALTSGTP